MSRPLVCLGLVTCTAAVLLANPNRDDKSAGPPLSQRDAQNYATQLAEITHFITEQYFREVSRTELATAALKGLYEAAGVPIPTGLEADVQNAATASEYALRRLFTRTRQTLGNPEPLRGSGALYLSLQALTQTLDPYSAVLTGTEVQRNNPNEPTQGFGLELLDSSGAGPLVIKSVIPGSPAQKSGLRPGDQITHINSEPANTAMATAVTFTKLHTVDLTLLRPLRKSPIKASLKSAVFSPETVLGVMRRPDNSWEYFLDREHKIAQIRIATLDAGVSDELARVLKYLGEANMRGLILDLRWCPGGFLDYSRDVADLFLGDYNLVHFMQPTPKGLLGAADLYLDNHCRNAAVRYRNNQIDKRIQHVVGSFTNFPMVVLVNGETTGGAELIAAVLQDNKRALIAGQRTRGKATVQRKWSLSGEMHGLTLTVPVPNMELKLSTGILVRPSEKNLNRFPDSKPADDWGVRPDAELEFRVSAEMGRRLQEWWQLQTLRPGSDNAALPLDDPDADPQRQASLGVLLDLLR